MSKVRIASRNSPLALWQANTVGRMLGQDYEIVEVKTTGDIKKDVSISKIGGIGAFAKEIQVSVLNNEADIAVHSAKDLPSITPDGLNLVSVPLRGDVRDVLIGSTLGDLKQGAVIATGSQRRRAQLSILRPDLEFADLRGNIATRIEKASMFDAIILANVALTRLEKKVDVFEVLEVSQMLPQVGQGALAIEVRSDDEKMIELVSKTNDVDQYRSVMAERAFLRVLGGGCSIPCGAYAYIENDDSITLKAMLADVNGKKVALSQQNGVDPLELGVRVANEILQNQGGKEIMSGINS